MRMSCFREVKHYIYAVIQDGVVDYTACIVGCQPKAIHFSLVADPKFLGFYL